MAEDGWLAAVIAEGDVAEFYLACQFGYVGQFIAGRQAQFSTFLTTVCHFFDALDRRIDSQSGLYAGNTPDDGINGFIDESL